MPVRKVAAPSVRTFKSINTVKKRPAAPLGPKKKAQASSDTSKRKEALRMLDDIETRAQAATKRARLVLEKLS
jgi:hypothetical protein